MLELLPLVLHVHLQALDAERVRDGEPAVSLALRGALLQQSDHVDDGDVRLICQAHHLPAVHLGGCWSDCWVHLRSHRVHCLLVSDLYFQMVLSLLHETLASSHDDVGPVPLLIIGTLLF